MEVKPTLGDMMKPPRPSRKGDITATSTNSHILTKKERMQIDKNVEIQRENRIMLRKLLEIDLKHSDLNKKKMKPAVFKLRSQSTGPRSNHPQLQVNLKTRVDEIRKVTGENKIILKKLQDIKPYYNHKKWEDDSQKMQQLSMQMSHNAGRYTKHPFFIQKNPAATFYRNSLHSSSSHKRDIVKNYQQFCHTFYEGGQNKSFQSLSPHDADKLSSNKKKKQRTLKNFLYSRENQMTLNPGEEYKNQSSVPFFIRRQNDVANYSQNSLTQPLNHQFYSQQEGNQHLSNINSMYQIGSEQFSTLGGDQL